MRVSRGLFPAAAISVAIGLAAAVPAGAAVRSGAVTSPGAAVTYVVPAAAQRAAAAYWSPARMTMATEPSRLLLMDRATFHSCLQRMPPLSYNLVRLLATRLRFANEQIQALSLPDLRCRVARQLSALADLYAEAGREGVVRIPLRLTAADLGALAGAPAAEVEPLLRELEERGCITRVGSRIEVGDRSELARCRRLPGGSRALRPGAPTGGGFY